MKYDSLDKDKILKLPDRKKKCVKNKGWFLTKNTYYSNFGSNIKIHLMLII